MAHQVHLSQLVAPRTRTPSRLDHPITVPAPSRNEADNLGICISEIFVKLDKHQITTLYKTIKDISEGKIVSKNKIAGTLSPLNEINDFIDLGVTFIAFSWISWIQTGAKSLNENIKK